MRRGRVGGPRWTTVLVALVAVTWCTAQAQDNKGEKPPGIIAFQKLGFATHSLAGSNRDNGCTKGSFSCADGSGCVDPSMVQDGVADCKDGSDEACRPLQFRCTCVLGADGKRGPRCLDAEMVRDGVKDCVDGEDERPEGHSTGDEKNCPKRKQDLLAPANQVTRSKRRASEVSTRIDGPVTTSMFAEDGLKGRLRPTGILTSTAGTFVLDGTTTEFATKVYGTHLDGGVYAKIVSTSSRVFFAVPSAGNLARIRPTGLLSGTTSTRVDGSATTLYTTEFSGTYIDGTYAQLVSSTSEVIRNTLKPTPALVSQTYQTVAPQMHEVLTSQQRQNVEGSGEVASPDQVVTVTGTRGALIDGAETKYDVFTGTHVKGDKTYLFFFGNTALSPTTAAVAGNEATAVRHPPGKASELVVRTGADDRIVVSVDDRELNLLLPKSARVSAAESGIPVQTNESGERQTTGGMRGVFIEGSEALGGFSIRGATEEDTKRDGSADTEMLTVTVGRGVAQTKIVRGRYEGQDGNVFEPASPTNKENISANRVFSEGVQSERTVYRFPPRIPALRPPRPAFGEGSRPKTTKDSRESEEEESENLLKARKLDFKDEGERNSGIRPSKVYRSNLPTFTVGQEGGFRSSEEDTSGKVVVRVDHNVEARVGARKDYRTLSARQRLGKSLPFRGFQVIHEKEDLVNAESGGSVAVPTITYFGFAEFTTTAHGTVIVFMPRSQEAVPSSTSHIPKTTAVSAYRLPSTRLPGPAFESVSGSGSGSKQKVATGIKTFYSHTPGMVTRTVTGHTLSMQTSLPTVLVEPVFGISTHGREKNGRSEDESSDAELVYPTSDAPEEASTTEREVTGEPLDFLEPSVSRPMADVVTSTSTFIENAHGRPFSVDLESSIVSVESTSSVISMDDIIPSAKPTEPLQPSATASIEESTETLPVGLIRSIEGTRALDGVTTIFTSMIFGTYIDGIYRQEVITTTNVLQPSTASELPTTPGITETTEKTEKEESSTTSSAPTVADVSETTFVTKELIEETTPPAMTTASEDEGVISTIPMSVTEENELANEVETGRKVLTSQEEQVIIADDSGKESSLEKGAPPVMIEAEEPKQSFLYSVIPTTIYQTYTYFTTFYIPTEGTTSASIRSREVIVSELALVTRSYPAESVMVTPTVTAATESTTQTPVPTTPMLPVTEETPQLPRDRVTVMLEESTTAETPVTTPMTPAKEEQQDVSEEDEEDSEEIELIFKTLYTTYTYLTTFFHDTTTSVSSREVVVTNVLTSTLNSVTLATEPALAGLVRDHDLSTSLPSPSVFDSEEEIPTSVGVGRPTTLFFPEDSISGTPTAPLLSTPTVDTQEAKKSEVDAKGVYRTFYTTYTYFTTVFVDGETEISSRTEVYTNIIPPSAVIQPTVTSSKDLATSAIQSNPTNEVESENLVRPSITISNPDRYSSTIMRRTGRKNADTNAAEVDATDEIKTPEQDSVPISSENHEEKQNVVWENQEANIVATGNKERVESNIASVSMQTSEENVVVTTEKYFGVTKFEEIGEAEKLLSEEDDQESSESNTEVVLPVPLPSPTPTQYPETSVLVQTTFTTFTYFTTLYRGGTSEVVSRLETVTNIMSLTVEPTAKTSENILPTNDVTIKPTLVEQDTPSTADLDESLYPITYFTTFTYWTTAYKGGSTVVNSREETVSNVVTPTVTKNAITKEIEPSVPIATTSDTITTNTEAPVEPAITPPISSSVEQTLITPSRTIAAPQLTTFYTTYTYFTTSYVGDSTIVNSRLETVTNVEEGDTQTPRAIGSSPPTQQQIVTPTKASDFPTGLLSTIRTSSVGEDSRTTLYSTDVYGTVIDGLYAKVLESSTRVLVEPISTSTPELPTVNLQPTGIVSLNAGSIVDAEGTATTFYSTMAIGTFIGNLYAQVVESTSSVVLDTDKTAIPLNTVSQRTGLVRLIKGSIVKGDATTFYESRVVGTVIDGRYAQIIESTSSFKGGEPTKTEQLSVSPSPTTTTVLSSTAAPALESSLGDVGSTVAPGAEEEQEEEGEGEPGEEGEEGDEDDSNNGNKGRVTSRLTFSSRRRTFTPVIRPFSSRNRPTFHPRRRPTSATTITRVTQTPTVTATPAHTDYLAATAARGRFSSRRGGTSSADIRASASGSRRFSRIRGSSSPGGAFGSSSYFGGSRGRGSSTRIIPTAASTLPFGGGRSRPGGYRSSFAGGGGRSSSEYPYGRTSSAALFAANSRYRIRPSSTSAYLRPTLLASASPPPFDRNTVEDEEEESTELEEEDEVGTEKEEGTRATEPTESTPSETALTATTEGSTSPFRSPLLRLRRPNQYKPASPPSTTPSSLPRSTAARRLSLLRRPNGEENLANEDRKPSRGRYKATSALPSKSTKNPTTPRPLRPSTPPRLPVLNRARPTSSLFPRRGLFRRPEEEKQVEEEAKESAEEDSEIVEEAESTANEGNDDDEGYALDESIADNDYEASEDVKRKNDAPRVLIRPFSPRRRRLKRQAEYGSRGTSNGGNIRGYSNRFRRPGSRKSGVSQEAEARVGLEETEVTYAEEEAAVRKQSEASNRQSPARSRNSGQQRIRPSAAAVQPRSQYTATGNRNKNTNTNTNTNNNNNNNNFRDTNSRTSFRRPSTTSSVRRRNKGDTVSNQQPQQRPKPPRLRTQSDTQTATVSSKPRSRGRFSNRARQSASSTTNTGRSRYRTSDLESNDYSTRRQYQSSWDGKVTVTHQIPTEATIPVVNGKNTEYRRVITASPSTQILQPGQYEATEVSGVAGLLLIGSDVTATPTPGIIHVTQYVARETPTTTVEFTPTVIRGRKTSFSHVIPSTAYGVEEVVSTLPSENGLGPSAPLANILLSQLLLGQFGLPGNVNPLLGLQQPNAAALAPPTPTTEFKTRSTTFVTTLTDKTSTVIPITLRGKAILTTIVDSSVQVVTATEFITETIVVTPTVGQQQQLNSLLLPALLQAQLLNQQQQQQPITNPLPGQLSPLQAAQLLQGQQQPTLPVSLNERPEIDNQEVIPEEEYVEAVTPAAERRRQPSSSRRRNRPHKRVEVLDEEKEDIEEGQRPARGSTEENPRPKSRKKQPSSGRKQQNPPAPRQYETSVITLYVSGRRPGDFSTVLSTISVDTAGSSLVKREAVSPKRMPSIQLVTGSPSLYTSENDALYANPEKFTNSLPFKDPNIFLDPSTVNFVPISEASKQGTKVFSHETESLESIVGDVSKHVVHQSSTGSPFTRLQSTAAASEDSKSESTASSHSQTGHFLAYGPAELAPLKRKVLSIDEGVEEEENEDEIEEYAMDGERAKREAQESDEEERPQKRRRVRVRVPVRKNPVARNQENSTPTDHDHGEVLTVSEAQRKNAMRQESEEAEEISGNNGFPSQRIKVIRGQLPSKSSSEGDKEEASGGRNKKRIRVKVRRKPNAVANDILPQPAIPDGSREGGTTLNGEGREKTRGNGRRRVVITKKRPSGTAAVQPRSRSAVVPETTGRHRVVITRRRPVHRQSVQASTTKDQPREDYPTIAPETLSIEPSRSIVEAPVIPTEVTSEKPIRANIAATIANERPTARKISSGIKEPEEDIKKIPPSEKPREEGKYASKIIQPKEESEESIEDSRNDDEESKTKPEKVEPIDEWVPSKVAESDYNLPTSKSVEPSFWGTREVTTPAETKILPPAPPKVSTEHQEESTGSEGPRFVRPTRFSVTRRPTGDFLQKVQSLRTKAPIVFPSRRRPSASTRQPAYRSRLSRLRGRPTSSSTTTSTSATTTFSETSATVEPTQTIELEPSVIATPTQEPIYITETVTETLLKTYTYVVSRVESSVEAGVAGEAAPPSLAAVSSTTEVKQVVKTRTVTRLLSPASATTTVPDTHSTALFSVKEGQEMEADARAEGGRMNIEAARFNLATRVMSNGVEVIVAGDKTTLPGGPDVLRILSTASRPITLAPSTLTDQMQLTVPTALGGGRPQGEQESLLLSLQSQAANFVTKTYATTYTYLTTFLQGSSTVVSSREDVISNVVTEEVRPTKPIQQLTTTSALQNEALTSEVDGPPSFVTSTYRTTFTYLNTIIDGEIPVVLTTRQTVANTVTSTVNPSIDGTTSEESEPGYLQPSEPTMYDTNTYFNTFTLTKTLSDSASGIKVISTEDVLTQVVITEASTPATTQTQLKISPTSTTNIIKTYYVTYTYYNTFLEKGSTVVKTNVATSSDVVTEKFYLAPTRTVPKTPPIPETQIYQHPSQTSVENNPSAQLPLNVFATKTYMTTFTYFTTLLENDQTVTRSSISVSTNLATEAITAGLDSVYLDSLRSSFSMQTAHAPIVATVMLSGTPMEITAFQGSVLDNSKSASESTQEVSSTETKNVAHGTVSSQILPTTSSSGNVIVGSTIIFFDDINPQKPQTNSDANELSASTSSISESTTVNYDVKDKETNSEPTNNAAPTEFPEFLSSSISSSPTPVEGEPISENDEHIIPQNSYITSTITASTVIASGNGLATTLVPGDAVIVSMHPNGNISLIPVSDPTNKNPDGALLGTGAVSAGAGTLSGGTGGGLLAAASGGPNIGVGVGDLINFGSLSLNGLNALGPVFNAMAGLIQSNYKSSRRNDTTTPHPIVAPHTPPPIALPRPPAPQSAPLIRDPVYIPVGGLASLTSDHIEPIAAESNNGESIEAYYGQNFAIHGFPDTQERRPPPSPVKPSMPTTLTLDNPLLLQNGIPIQPGQVITTNSDVIVGKPSVLGPRPSSHGGVPQIYPENQSPLPQVHNSSPTVLVPSNHLPHPNYQRKPSVHPPSPPRARPGNDVPPEMRPPPPPRFQSYTGVSPTRVSVISGVETVFIGKPLPPHMVPENHSPASHHNHQIPSHITGPLRGDAGNYQAPANIPPPPIIVGSPLDNLNPHPVAFHQNHNTIDRSTGYKIRPSQSLNIPVEAVTLSVGSETNPNAQDPISSYFEISSPPISGGRPGSVLNAGEPHAGHQITLGQAQVHNVPVGTGGEVVVEIGRPPITDVINQYTEEAQIITNDDSSEDNRGVVQEEGEDTIKRHPTLITQHEPAEHGIHTGSITIGHGRPNYQQPNQVQHLNFFGQKRPNQTPGNIPPSSPFSHIHNPQSPVGAIQRPPPLSVVYTNGMSTHSSPVDHLMPPPPPPTRPNSNVLVESGGLHKNDGPIIIPLNHGHKETSHENGHSESLRPQHSENIPRPWLNNNDEDFGEPEDEEGAQDGEVLQESNNHPVRPVQLPTGEQQHLGRPSAIPDIHHNREKPQLSQTQHSHNGINLHQILQNNSSNSPVMKPKVKPQHKINASEGNFPNQPPLKHQNNLHEPPPYQFEIPDMPPPPLNPATSSPKPSQPHRPPPNSQRPPPGAVSRPAIRPQDYNPDFLDKPIRISSRPHPPSRTPINDGSTVQENVIRPEVSRPPVRVVVRPASPHHPRPPFNNHHVAQPRPPQISHWSRPVHQLKPPGPGQVLRIPSPAPSRLPSSSWQPSISTTTRRKIVPSLKIPHQEVAVVPTISSSLGADTNIKVSGVPPHRIDPSFSLEKDPFVAISTTSSSETFIESSRTSALWEGDSFNSIPTIELPPPVATSILSDSVEPTTLLSGTSTIFGGLYSRVTSSKTSEADSTVLGDLFLSPSSHGAIPGNNGRPLVASNENHPPLPQYTDEDEELENEFEEGEGLGAAGSNDDITSVVVVSVTATPTTRYVTRTETETHTITQTVIESRPGSLPKTRTVIVTQTVAAEMARPITIVSTIVGTVTEVHTTVEASTTTAVTTVTVTAPTQYPLHTVGSYESGEGSREKPENVGHAGDSDVSADKTLANENSFPQGSPFDSLRPTISSTTASEELLSIDHGVLSAGNEGESEEREELNENVHGDEIADEEYTETILPTSEGSEEERKQLKCDPGCDASRNEICVDEEGEDEMIGGAIEGPRCICRPGFDRLFPDRPCMPTYTYQLRLLLDRIGKRRLRYNADLNDPQTEEFRQLQEYTQDGLERVAMQSDLRDLFHGISIAGFQPLSENDEAANEGSETTEEERGDGEKAGSQDDGVIVHFYVKLSDNIEENKLKEMFEKTLKQSNYSVGGTDLFARRKEGLLEISDFDECSNPDFNDCSDQAQCFNLRGTYTCSCKEGFADMSENSEFPGRICSAEVLGCETCKYHGKCYTDTNGKVGCKCFHWYSGEKCQINLKVLLIALVTIGAILLILVFVCIMLACMKRRKPEIRHSAPGFMRYRGPAGIIRGGGTLDKTAMIPDTSSESSFEGALPPPPLTYVPLGHHRLSMSTQGSKLKSEGLITERRDKNVPIPFRGPQSANAGFNEQDRSLTVMIPRAKYRPAPHLIASAASPVSPSPMTSFGVVVLDGENREQREFPTSNNEHKLMAFLDGTDSHNLGRQGTPTKQKQIGPTVTNHESSGNPKKLSSSQKPSTGALVSAGFEVSATVVKDKWPPESSNNSKQIEDDADDIIGTGRGIDSQLHDTLASNGSHFTTLRTGDRTVSEARSYDETIVHPPKKSFLQGALSACGSKPSSQHGLHHSNDEAHTMAERDVGSTFLMPQTQLYKPSRGSDNSNFDSL